MLYLLWIVFEIFFSIFWLLIVIINEDLVFGYGFNEKKNMYVFLIGVIK